MNSKDIVEILIKDYEQTKGVTLDKEFADKLLLKILENE